jgi:hypothetical protein
VNDAALGLDGHAHGGAFPGCGGEREQDAVARRPDLEGLRHHVPHVKRVQKVPPEPQVQPIAGRRRLDLDDVLDLTVDEAFVPDPQRSVGRGGVRAAEGSRAHEAGQGGQHEQDHEDPRRALDAPRGALKRVVIFLGDQWLRHRPLHPRPPKRLDAKRREACQFGPGGGRALLRRSTSRRRSPAPAP